MGEYPKSRFQGWISTRLIFGNYICNSTILARAQAGQEAGFFDESIFIPADWDMWLRLSEKYQVGYINEPLTNYRVSDNTILKSLAQSQKEERVVLNKYFD